MQLSTHSLALVSQQLSIVLVKIRFLAPWKKWKNNRDLAISRRTRIKANKKLDENIIM